jgi:hypothetical protein
MRLILLKLFGLIGDQDLNVAFIGNSYFVAHIPASLGGKLSRCNAAPCIGRAGGSFLLFSAQETVCAKSRQQMSAASSQMTTTRTMEKSSIYDFGSCSGASALKGSDDNRIDMGTPTVSLR